MKPDLVSGVEEGDQHARSGPFLRVTSNLGKMSSGWGSALLHLRPEQPLFCRFGKLGQLGFLLKEKVFCQKSLTNHGRSLAFKTWGCSARGEEESRQGMGLRLVVFAKDRTRHPPEPSRERVWMNAEVGACLGRGRY